jgi:hypothetical protein
MDRGSVAPERTRSAVGVVAAVVACAGLASVASADREITGRVKSTSTSPFTSWLIETNNPNTAPNGVLGWNLTQLGPKTWEFSGGLTNPGDTFTATLHNPFNTNPGGQVTGGDYLSNGNQVWVKKCSDPLAMRVVSGGASGTSYLGYSIPAGQYGYFYQMYNQTGYGGVTKTMNITIGAGTSVSNLQVLNNHFAFLPVAGFDLDDLALPDVNRLDNNYDVQQYMEPGDATGVAGTVPLSWALIGNTARMEFFPEAPEAGMGAAASGSICAFTSSFAPGITDTANAVSSFVNTFNCTNDYALVPTIPVPAPGSLVLLGLGGLLTLRRPTRRPARPKRPTRRAAAPTYTWPHDRPARPA